MIIIRVGPGEKISQELEEAIIQILIEGPHTEKELTNIINEQKLTSYPEITVPEVMYAGRSLFTHHIVKYEKGKFGIRYGTFSRLRSR